MTNSTAFVDVTNPVNPVFLGRIDSNAGNNFWRDVKIYANYAFIVADDVGEHGMQIFDLTRLRNITNPESMNPDVVYDCLLYTSPSPRDRQKSRMPSSA